VLAINGSLDIQVLIDQNLPAIPKALARNKPAEIDEFPGLNHLFQIARTGSPAKLWTNRTNDFAGRAREKVKLDSAAMTRGSLH
jgi:uncharacterized protein